MRCALPPTAALFRLLLAILTTRGAALKRAPTARQDWPITMSLVLEGAIPPSHLLQSRSASWPCPYPLHDCPASDSSPTPMSPQSLHSYMPRMPESPLPSQEMHSLPASGWYGPSISAPECHHEVCSPLALLRLLLTCFPRRATPHLVNLCLRIPRPSLSLRPRLACVIQRSHQPLPPKWTHQQRPSLQSLIILGIQYCPALRVHQKSRSRTKIALCSSLRRNSGHSHTSWIALIVAQVCCILHQSRSRGQ